jgi:predicted DsbA family dithiol-disulfide isomerase
VTGKESLQPPTVVVHGDYLDPFTRAAVAAVAEAGGRVAFRHLPRRSGLAAAVAAEAARELGAFDAMHERLLAHDGPLDTEDLRRYAGEAGLDPDAFESVFGSDDQMARLRADVEAAGTNDPPVLYLDGERLASYEPGWLRERFAATR